MTGPKTNERPGTRASVRHVRGSATKARRVLDMIRNQPVQDAQDLLEFSETGVSEIIAKVLNSAIANAEHNDEIPAEELFVSACYADEGPTLKRWRPRARGRATQIRKRTSHITLIVSRFEAEELEARREAAAASGTSSAAQAEARRRRVAASQDDAAASQDDAAASQDDAAASTDDSSAAGAAAAAATNVGDDLTDVTGIGPKYADQLAALGVTSIAGLAAIDDAKREEIREEIKGDDIDSWVEQAKEMAGSSAATTDSEEEE